MIGMYVQSKRKARCVPIISKILCVGMATCDILLKPIPENILSIDTCVIEPPLMQGGGDALNVARILAKLGLSASLCSRISPDGMGKMVLEELLRMGVNADPVITRNANPTATSFVLLDERGERHFASSKEIFQELSDEDVTEAMLESHSAVYYGSAMQAGKMDRGGVERLFRRARARRLPTFLDAAIAPDGGRPWGEILSGALKETDYFLPSRAEAEAISGETDLEKQVEFFRPFGLKALVIKLGGKGCFVTDFSKEAFIPPVTVEAVNTNGAGDSFVAGFICALSRGMELFRACAFANGVGALKVSGDGALGALEGYEQALALLEEQYP